MNGFRAELLGRVLGFNGHATVVSRARGIDGLRQPGRASCAGSMADRRHALCRGPGDGQRQRRRRRRPRPRRAARRTSRSADIFTGTVLQGSLDGLAAPRARRRSARAWPSDGATLGSDITLISPKGASHRLGHRAAHQGLQGGRRVRGRDVRVRQQLRLHPARRRAGLFPAAATGSTRSRSWSPTPSGSAATARRWRQRSPARTPAWSTGSSSTRISSPRSRSSAT